MKKIFFATATFMLLTVITYANTGKEPANVSKRELRKDKREQRRESWQHSANVMTEDQLWRDFPNAKNVSWKEAAFSEATFQDGDVIKTAYYDSDNKLVGTTCYVGFSALPAKAQEYINKKYPGYKVEKVVLFDDNQVNDTDMFLFGNAFEDEDNYFPVLSRGTKEIILKVTIEGDVSFFQNYK